MDATKAGLRYEKRALLLGLLLDAAERIRGDEAERAHLLALGEKAFVNDTDYKHYAYRARRADAADNTRSSGIELRVTPDPTARAGKS